MLLLLDGLSLMEADDEDDIAPPPKKRAGRGGRGARGGRRGRLGMRVVLFCSSHCK